MIAPLKYTHTIVCLHTWPAAVGVNYTFLPPLVGTDMISALVSETGKP